MRCFDAMLKYSNIRFLSADCEWFVAFYLVILPIDSPYLLHSDRLSAVAITMTLETRVFFYT